MRRFIMGLVFATVSLSPAAFAQGTSGTAAEAKAMLTKAIASVKDGKAKAIEMFNKGEGGFKDRDLYVFCANVSDGKFVAHVNPQLIGTDARTLTDSTGHKLGQEIYDLGTKAKEGEIVESTPYLFPRPGPDKTPVAKVAFVSKIGDIYCGAGYYK
jgi:signal transduction histidine kinase